MSDNEDLSVMPIDESMFEAPMSANERAIRDLFVSEYLKDRNSYHAALRCGFTVSFAKVYAKQFMEEPYVRKLIGTHTHNDIESDPSVKEDFEKAARRRTIEALEKEAHYYGPGSSHAARVSAAGKLAEILDMKSPTKIDINTSRGGVMLVPATADLEQWQKDAAKQQAALTAGAAEDVSG